MSRDDTTSPIPMNPEALRDYIARHHEKEYVLIDVRQPAEYELSHIPGARMLPLMEFESKLFELPEKEDLIFYCRSGGRSMAAADLAVEAEATQGNVYNLSGGIMAWFGQTLSGFPRVDVFDPNANQADQLMTAMNLEKGAWRFYRHVITAYAQEAFIPTFQRLSKAETAHARAVYAFWHKLQPTAPPFESLYDDLTGDVLEGGEKLDDLLQRLDSLSDNRCLDLIEISLAIEHAAFDLYRTMAHQADEADARRTFLSIAQAEKGHMKLLTRALADCPRI